MIKPIGPQYQAAKNNHNRRVGLTHVSKVIERLMRIYGLEDDMIDHQEMEAAQMQTTEFQEPVVVMPSVGVAAGTQATFSWFD